MSVRSFFFQGLSETYSLESSRSQICGLQNFLFKNGKNLWLCEHHVKNCLGYLNEAENACCQFYSKDLLVKELDLNENIIAEGNII